MKRPLLRSPARLKEDDKPFDKTTSWTNGPAPHLKYLFQRYFKLQRQATIDNALIRHSTET